MNRLSYGWLDVVAVVAFVVIGRDTHNEGSALADVAVTATPFLIALPIGWLTVGVRDLHHLRSGLYMAGLTVGIGMALRRFVFDRGTAVSFVLVAAVFLTLTMVGWRYMVNRSGRISER